MCGRLNVSIYGTRDAASNWEKTYSDALISIGVVRGISSPCTFYHPVYDIKANAHGDEFTILGTDEAMTFTDTNHQGAVRSEDPGQIGPISY